jgi:BirA family transcriptional regulator, biotin operon repressor / biotin---[acetyl-CoA-carboxylase] ligase
MIRHSRLPPLFRLHPIGSGLDVGREAARLAEAGGDPATVICAEREDLLDCAVILHPETELADAALVMYVAMLGLGDALGAEVQAGIDMTFRWPNLIEANLGAVARLGLVIPDAAASDAVPGWMAVRLTVQIAEPAGGWREGEFPETSLFGEGCVEVTGSGLLESFARHFLTWLNRWQHDGFDPVRAMWLRHARFLGERIEIPMSAGPVRGLFSGIGDDGAGRLGDGAKARHVGLLEAIDVSVGNPA